MIFNTVGIIGFGLIGSSIAHNIRNKNLASNIICLDTDQNVCDTALDLGLADHASTKPDIIAQCDLIILAVPVGAMEHVMRVIIPFIKDKTIITDVGSVKMAVIEKIEKLCPDTIEFIAGHPVAGTEFSGPEAGFEDLFKDKLWLLTPSDKTSTVAIDKIKDFCRLMGAIVHIMQPKIHDKTLAMTSHLPQLISYMIMNAADDLGRDLNHDVISYSANGFHGFARIAVSDPTMWRDIYLNNKMEILNILDGFQEHIDLMRGYIVDEKGEEMYNYFEKSKQRRLKHLSDKDKAKLQ